MATIFECETLDYPGYVGPLISNCLLAITFLSIPQEGESGDEALSRERKLFKGRLELVGILATLKYRMEISGHPRDACKIGVLLEMSINNDVSDPDLRKAFQEKADRLYA